MFNRISVIIPLLAVLTTTLVRAQTPQAALLDEIRQLRRELLEERRERQFDRTAMLEREISVVSADLRRMEELEHAQETELGAWIQELQNSDIPTSEHPQLLSMKAALASEGKDRLLRQHAELTQRERALAALVATAHDQLRRLEETLQRLAVAP